MRGVVRGVYPLCGVASCVHPFLICLMVETMCDVFTTFFVLNKRFNKPCSDAITYLFLSVKQISDVPEVTVLIKVTDLQSISHCPFVV